MVIQKNAVFGAFFSPKGCRLDSTPNICCNNQFYCCRCHSDGKLAVVSANWYLPFYNVDYTVFSHAGSNMLFWSFSFS